VFGIGTCRRKQNGELDLARENAKANHAFRVGSLSLTATGRERLVTAELQSVRDSLDHRTLLRREFVGKDIGEVPRQPLEDVFFQTTSPSALSVRQFGNNDGPAFKAFPGQSSRQEEDLFRLPPTFGSVAEVSSWPV
jgi:hypothetical protein